MAAASEPLAAAAPVAPPAFEVPTWAFPGVLLPRRPPREYDDTVLLRVPDSDAGFTEDHVGDLFHPLDWFPERHPSMPPVVAGGRPPRTFACAHCHLPDGTGRPENAALAGLPADYIRAQVAAIRSGARDRALRPTEPARLPMEQVADSAADVDVAAAAEYYSRLPMRRRVTIVESERVPKTRETRFVYLLDEAGGDEPLGARLIEVPNDTARHERHDPYVEYRTYVPPGSVARGRHLAETGGEGATVACGACHGEGLRGSALAPPLAGRSPSYQLRQLLAFRSGKRHSPAAMAMHPVVARLTVDNMVALAAYAATLEP